MSSQTTHSRLWEVFAGGVCVGLTAFWLVVGYHCTSKPTAAADNHLQTLYEECNKKAEGKEFMLLVQGKALLCLINEDSKAKPSI